MITLEIQGVEETARHIEALPETLREKLRASIERFVQDAYNRVRDKLSGGVLQRRSGRLLGAVNYNVEDRGSGLRGTLSVDSAAAPYAAIQEYGGETRAHPILPKSARILAFPAGGKTVFARRVNHPGSVIPERSYLRSTLAEMKPDIQAELASTVADGDRP